MDSSEVRFGRFRLNLRQRALSRDGTLVRLSGRPLDILCVLASARGDVVTKDDLMARIWPGQIVEENAIQVQVSTLRKVLDDGRSGHPHIITVPSRGYRLVTLQQNATAEPSEADNDQRLIVPGTSIAVLPFQNMSGDPEQEYFADGIVEDIITGLARIKWFFVIARNSSFIFRGKAADVKQVGRDLGVRYVLEGSVRKSGNRARITAQLIDAQTGIHIWAERYDRMLDDIFAVQDEITMSVIGAVEPSIRKVEIERVRRKRPDSLDAYDLVLRALPLVHKRMPRDATAAIPLIEQALTLEPGYAVAHALLAWCFHFRFRRGDLREEDRVASIRHAHLALAAGDDDATTLAIVGIVLWFNEHDIKRAFELFDRALALSNSNVLALSNSALALAWMEKTEAAIERAHHALRISPYDTVIALNALAAAHLHAKRYPEAVDAATRAVESSPDFSISHAYLAAALVRSGRLEEARVTARRVLTLDPTMSIRRWSAELGFMQAVFDPFAEALHAAGIPKT